jgi:hypothetical protein
MSVEKHAARRTIWEMQMLMGDRSIFTVGLKEILYDGVGLTGLVGNGDQRLL